MKIIALIALLAVSSAQATVVIYTQALKQIVAGKKATFTTNYTGYLVLGSDAATFQVNVRSKAKTFTVTEYDDFKLAYVNNTATKRKLVIARENLNYEIGTFFIKGDAVPLSVGTSTTFSSPVIMTLGGSGFSGSSPLAVLTTWSGIFAFDSKKTIMNNLVGNDAGAAVNFLRTYLTGKGYTEIP